MPIEPGATYVFDLGYYDYAWWAELDAVGCRIVTRFKSNTPLHAVEELPVPEGGNILSDRIGFLPARLMYSRRNPMSHPVREVRVRTETGKVLRILSNDLDASAQEIADLYKRRWAIELFFRWIKQTLKIRHFLGTSENAVREVRVTTETGKVLRILSNDLDATAQEIADLYRRRWAIELFFRWIKQTLKITRFVGTSENAVRIQIAVALIAFLLLRLAQAAQKCIQSPITFARLIRANLMHRRRLDHLLQVEPPPPFNPAQLGFQWNPT